MTEHTANPEDRLNHWIAEHSIIKKYLHITNGDSAAELIQDSDVAGDVLPWRDPMHHGPFPHSLELDSLSRLRFDYLSGGSEEGDDSSHGFSRRDATLRASTDYDEVVLWFEHDLLDQLQILQLLDWFNQFEVGNCRLTMICINHFPNMAGFRGLGQLTPAQIATLFPAREDVSRTELEYARQGWQAFRQDDPKALTTFLSLYAESNESAAPLPFLPAALHRHCQEFPWYLDGLTRTERQILSLAANGVQTPDELFIQNMDFEQYLYIGDARTYSIIEKLCNTIKPLLKRSDGKAFEHPYSMSSASATGGSNLPALNRKRVSLQKLVLTEYGRRVLAGDIKEGSPTVERDEWLGGVHLETGKSAWLWNDNEQRFV